MENPTITTDTHIHARWILTALNETVAWARMAFKPRKSRSLIIKIGKITEQFQLMVQEEKILSTIGHTIKCLGKRYDETLCDRTNISRIEQQVFEGMRNIDKICLPRTFKAWIYQHGCSKG